MSTHDRKHHDEPKAVHAAPVPAIVCSVCGQGENLTGSAGVARWHAECEAARPDVIKKVKARS